MTELDDGYVEDAPQVYDGPPIPVHITSGSIKGGEFTERLAPDYGSTGTFQLQLAGMAQPVQILQRRYRRSKARVLVMSLGAGSAEISGSNPAPGTGFTYTNTSGLTQFLQSLSVFFTADATVLNRFLSIRFRDAAGNTLAIVANGAATVASSTITINGYIGASQQNSASGTFTAPLPQNLAIPPGGQIVVTAASLGPADQFSGIILNFSQTGVNAVFHNRPDILSLPTIPAMTGIQVSTAPYSFDWESQQPLYGVGIGGLVTVSVIDETYADVTT